MQDLLVTANNLYNVAGMVCFFTSYLYLENVVATWYDHAIITDLQRHKLVFIETQDDAETSLALINYMKVMPRLWYSLSLLP